MAKQERSKSTNRPHWATALIAASLLGSAAAHAQSETKLTASDGAAGDEFGMAMAVSGDLIVVAARRDDDLGTDSGSAYLFRRGAGVWLENAKLLASDGGAGDLFGSAVAAQGNRLVVGAIGDDDRGSSAGAAYVFDFDGTAWQQTQKLLASDGHANAQLGVSVALDGDRILLGAFQQNSRGAAYVFDFDGSTGTWSETQKLTASNAAAADLFGDSVALRGDTAFVGAPGVDGPGDRAGAGYVFEFSGVTWVQTTMLKPANLGPTDNFGSDVVLSGDGDRIVSGAREHGGAGAVYVFDRGPGDWSVVTELAASDGQTGDRFGHSIAIDGDRVLVGAQQDDGGIGSAYLFELPDAAAITGWREMQRLAASDGAPGDQLGQDVALEGRYCGACAHRDDAGRGAAYVFEQPLIVDPTLSTIVLDHDGIPAAGGSTTVRVVPRDAAGNALGSGLNVSLQTTGGTLQGTVVEQNGEYTQLLLASLLQDGADVAATVEGVPLARGARVLFLAADDDAAPPPDQDRCDGPVVGVDHRGELHVYRGLQRAVRRAHRDHLARILVPPGEYGVIDLRGCRNLRIEGLLHHGLVTVRAFLGHSCRNVELVHLAVRCGVRGDRREIDARRCRVR